MSSTATDPIAVLKAIKTKGEATAKEVGTSAAYLRELVSEGLLVEADKLRTGARGRPATLFKVAKKGTDQLRRK